MARIYCWPPPEVWRLLAELATVAGLALEAVLVGDHDLLIDASRWHESRRAELARLRDEGST